MKTSKITSKITKALIIIILLCGSNFISALMPVPPILQIVDLTHTLTAQQSAHLTHVLSAFEAQKGSQIAVLIVDTTTPETIEQYSLRVADTWKLGRKNIDDGVLLVIAMKDRTLRIEVGYGLEGPLNDALCKRIIHETITPYFKQGKFYEGIEQGINQMIKIIQGEPLPPVKSWSFANRSYLMSDFGNIFFLIILISIIACIFLKYFFGHSIKNKIMIATIMGIKVGLISWILIDHLLLSLFFGLLAFLWIIADYNNPWSGGSFGGGSSWGGGGGSFGGGGSSGKW
jgi:uncharacterized protein